MKVVTSSFFFSEIIERNVRLNLDICMIPPPQEKVQKSTLTSSKPVFFCFLFRLLGWVLTYRSSAFDNMFFGLHCAFCAFQKGLLNYHKLPILEGKKTMQTYGNFGANSPSTCRKSLGWCHIMTPVQGASW